MVAEVKRIYTKLGLNGFERVEPELRAFSKPLSQGKFKKNKHVELPVGLKEKVQQRWGASFKEFNYPL
jgi:hypothetical protein